LSAHLNSAGFIPIIVTNCLEGNATKLGQSMARILVKLATQAKHLASNISNFLKEEFALNVDISVCVFNVKKFFGTIHRNDNSPERQTFFGESSLSELSHSYNF